MQINFQNLKDKILSIIKNDYFKILAFTFLVGFIFFPLSDSINFYQNDDWVYYKAISQFLTGNYEIPRYIEALFYTQGFLGTVFASIYGLEKLPVLTFVFSILTFLIFQIIVRTFYVKSFHETVIISLFLFVSPLFIYSSLGFMSDIYFLFFLLCGILFYELFNRNPKWYYFLGFNILMVVGFFTRQLSIITGVVFFIVLLIQKKFKWAILQIISNLTLLLSYFYFVPKTSTMESENQLSYFELLKFDTTFSITYAGLIYAVAFIAPLTLLLVKKFLNDSTENKKIRIIYLISILITFICFYFLFNPKIPNNENMFYFKNTLGRTGFFFGNHLGNKYSIYYSDAIYYIFEIICKITLAVFFTSSLFLFKKLFNLYSLFIIFYLGLMVVLPGGVYDRYYLVLIPITILLILNFESKLNLWIKSLSVISIIIIGFYSYNFAMDFVLVHNYVWKSARNLVNIKNVDPIKISAGNAWNRTYVNSKLSYKYIFYFETRDSREDLKCCYEIYDKFQVNYPFNFFEKPVVYLYRSIN